jgi:hypothetical protein
MLHRDFCQQFVPRLQQAVWYNLLNPPVASLRNYKQKEFSFIKKALSALLKRIYSIGEKSDLIDLLVLDLAWMCFDSQVLDKKIWGLKEITDMLKDAKSAPTYARVNIAYLVYNRDIYIIKNVNTYFLKNLYTEKMGRIKKSVQSALHGSRGRFASN